MEITLYQAILQANSSGNKSIKGGYAAVVESGPNDSFVFGSTSAPVYLLSLIHILDLRKISEADLL